jgi:hypothetical protein
VRPLQIFDSITGSMFGVSVEPASDAISSKYEIRDTAVLQGT